MRTDPSDRPVRQAFRERPRAPVIRRWTRGSGCPSTTSDTFMTTGLPHIGYVRTFGWRLEHRRSWRGGRYGPRMDEQVPYRDTASSAGKVRLLNDADWEWRQRGPTSRAVRAFGVREHTLRRLPGGAGHAWTDGCLVLKPVGLRPGARLGV